MSTLTIDQAMRVIRNAGVTAEVSDAHLREFLTGVARQDAADLSNKTLSLSQEAVQDVSVCHNLREYKEHTDCFKNAETYDQKEKCVAQAAPTFRAIFACMDEREKEREKKRAAMTEEMGGGDPASISLYDVEHSTEGLIFSLVSLKDKQSKAGLYLEKQPVILGALRAVLK